MEITAPVVGEVSAQAWNDIENICKSIHSGKPSNLEENRDGAFREGMHLDFHMRIGVSDCP